MDEKQATPAPEPAPWVPPVIRAQAETVEHPDGRRDVVIHVPMLAVHDALRRYHLHREAIEHGKRSL